MHILFRLPITQEKIDSFLQCQSPGDFENSTISGLNICELASLQILEALISKKGNAPKPIDIERKLSNIINNLRSNPLDAKKCAYSHLVQLDTKTLKDCLHPDLKVELMDQEEFEEKKYIDSSGNWVWQANREQYGPRRRNVYIKPLQKTSDKEQKAIIRSVIEDGDRSKNITAHAGTGKTRTVIALCCTPELNKPSTYVLVKNKSQYLSNALTRNNCSVKIYDHEQFALSLFPKTSSLWGQRLKSAQSHHNDYSSSYFSYRNAINNLSSKVNEFYSDETTALAVETVKAFCLSSDREILPNHIPKMHDPTRIASLSIIKTAQAIWKDIRFNFKNSSIPVFYWHLLKIADIEKVPLPPIYQQLIVDEYHDTPPVIGNLLNDFKQEIIVFNDPMQATEYAQQVEVKKGFLAKSEMSLSFRQDKTVNPLVSKIIGTKSQAGDQPIFLGNATHKTLVRHYKPNKFTIPYYACTILSASLWYSFHAITQLLEAKASLKVLPKTKLALQRLIPDAIRYKNYCESKRGTAKPRISHIELTAQGAESWSELVNKSGHENGLVEVARYLDKTGITDEQALSLLSRDMTRFNSSYYTVGLISDAKSLEMNRVVLTPDVHSFSDQNLIDDLTLNMIYTGVTRGKFELIVPDSYIFVP